jgi:CheY-like chemotaxis protein
MEVMGQQPLVSVVDDDESVRESLPDLLRQCGFAAQTFSSAEAFLASEALDEALTQAPDHRRRWVASRPLIPGLPLPVLRENVISRLRSRMARQATFGVVPLRRRPS